MSDVERRESWQPHQPALQGVEVAAHCARACRSARFLAAAGAPKLLTFFSLSLSFFHLLDLSPAQPNRGARRSFKLIITITVITIIIMGHATQLQVAERGALDLCSRHYLVQRQHTLIHLRSGADRAAVARRASIPDHLRHPHLSPVAVSVFFALLQPQIQLKRARFYHS